jgi:hypothetical protein
MVCVYRLNRFYLKTSFVLYALSIKYPVQFEVDKMSIQNQQSMWEFTDFAESLNARLAMLVFS